MVLASLALAILLQAPPAGGKTFGPDLDAPPPGGEAAAKPDRNQAGAADTLDAVLTAELMPRLFVARLVGPDGKPAKSAEPQVKKRDDGQADCSWGVEIYFDTDFFYGSLAPGIDAALAKAAKAEGGPLTATAPLYGKMRIPGDPAGHPIFGTRKWQGAALPRRVDNGLPYAYAFLSTARGRNSGATERFQWYLLEGDDLEALGKASLPNRAAKLVLNLALLDQDQNVIESVAVSPWKGALVQEGRDRPREVDYLPFLVTPDQFETVPKLPSAAVISPRFGLAWANGHKDADWYKPLREQHDFGWEYPESWRGSCDVIVKRITATLPAEDVAKIRTARLSFTQDPQTPE